MEYISSHLVDLQTSHPDALPEYLLQGFEVVAVMESSEVVVVDDTILCNGGFNGFACRHGINGSCTMHDTVDRSLVVNRPMFLIGRSTEAHKVAERERLDEMAKTIAEVAVERDELRTDRDNLMADLKIFKEKLDSAVRQMTAAREAQDSAEMNSQNDRRARDDARADLRRSLETEEKVRTELMRVHEERLLGIHVAVEHGEWMTPLQFFIYLRELNLFLEDAGQAALFFQEAQDIDAVHYQRVSDGERFKVNSAEGLLGLVARFDAVGRLTSEEMTADADAV